MSMATLERAILGEARIFFQNPKLRLKDIQEWSTGDVKQVEGEITARMPIGASVAIKVEFDKRKTAA